MNNIERDAIDQILDDLAPCHHPHLSALRQILAENWARGRHRRYQKRNRGAKVDDYIRHVAHIYQRDRPFFNKLLEEQDNDAWRQLHAKLYEWAVGRISKYKHGQNLKDDATALAQEVCIKLLSGKAKYTYDSHDLDAWLYTTVKYTTYKYFRTQKTRTDNEQTHEDWAFVDTLLLTSSAVPKPEHEAAKSLRHDHLYECIEELPEGQRKSIYLYLEGLTPEEIAELLGIKRNAVDQRLYHARKRIGRCWEEKFED